MAKHNAFYAQSGGVSSVINASACGVIETCRQHSDRIGHLYAGHNGIIGALTEDLIDVGQESDEAIAALRHTPGGAFGSCRYKLKGIDTHRVQYERLIEVFQAHDIRYFFYNGGGDSADTCLKVSQLSERMGYPLQAIHVAKTVDNDLPLTDNSPGFGSVAKYIATSIREAALDVASMCATSTKVFVMEAMGRHAGWIAAAGALAGGEGAAPPHMVIFPEVPFDRRRVMRKVDETVKQYGYCVIVVSEGARYEDGSFLADAGNTDAFGHRQLGGVAPTLAGMVKQDLGYKYHWSVPDYLQRSARHLASRVDVEQAYAVGVRAVECALEGKNAIMPAIRRDSQSPYSWSIFDAPLADIANQEKFMPADFIREDGFGITQPCRDYLEPLIQGEDFPPFVNGMPDYAKLKLATVPKKLAPFEI
ncbi:6-phosphofructokinase [Larsenimonas rhizosphaerae]|uniref:Pyrophosphate--fructose 6-phosphate 1-phosphotransferase n=1 Tax=Larsenimonas rhizosphaerae TaxID=2944682 RepID=A0AA41ZGN1_9GAMM|nr:6-phosphofructokinase [Larsenimonas rhizosphaerae]MCM2130844.1 6-phosphofructokinase [Larsenimonas rhizosphaerae]MCX2523548.1 6-phosphofructokinase [Larsenimonas rhizosphaerae]